MISYPLNTLLITLSDNLSSSSNNNGSNSSSNFFNSGNENSFGYTPEKELRAVLKSLTFCDSEKNLRNILKHFKTFLDFSPNFQRLFVNCGVFNKLLEILDKTLENLENNNYIEKHDSNYKIINDSLSSNSDYDLNNSNIKNRAKIINKLFYSSNNKINNIIPFSNSNSNTNTNNNRNPFSAEMLMKILKIIELILNKNSENISIFKTYYLLDNYFDKFTSYTEYKQIAYKIWNICMTYENDSNELVKYTKFLLRRYYVLKETLKKSESIISFKIILHEIFRINEIICINFLSDNIYHLFSGSNNHIFLKEILLDFVKLLNIIKNQNLFIDNNSTDENKSKKDTYWDMELHSILKNFISNFINVIFHFNKNLFFIKFKYSKLNLNKNKLNKNIDPLIKKEDLKFIIERSISILSELQCKGYLLDLIKFLIDSSLRFKLNEKANSNMTRKMSEIFNTDKSQDEIGLDNNLFASNFQDYYKDTFNVEESFLNNSYTSTSNYSNFILQSPMIIIILLSCLKKIKNSKLFFEFLEMLDFLCKVNENNIKILLKHKIVKNLIDILRKKNNSIKEYINSSIENCNKDENLSFNKDDNLKFEICNKVVEIFEIITKFMSKNDLEYFFEFILTELSLSSKPDFKLNSVNKNELTCIDIIKLNGGDGGDGGDGDEELNNIPLQVNSSNAMINIINRLLIIFHKNLYFARKIKRNIILSSIITRQPNIYNMLYTGNICFSTVNQMSPKEILLSFDSTATIKDLPTSKAKVSNNLSIFISLKFHKTVRTSLTLFKFERDNLPNTKTDKDKEKDNVSFEVCIENNILIVKENEREVYQCDELTKYIRIDKNTVFLFVLDKEVNSMEVFINEKLLYVPNLDFKFLDAYSFVYNLTSGYAGSATQELYQDSFQLFPHVSVSHFMIYSDKITKENMVHFKLSQVFNSKNGSVKANTIKLKYLNKKTYKMFAPHYINQKEILKYVRLNIDPEKVIYELIPDKFDLLTNNKLTKLKGDANICNNFLYKINRKYNIDLLEKEFVVYVPNTNYVNYEGYLNLSDSSNASFYNHTYLLSKLNFSEAIYLNQIFDIKNLKMSLLSEIIGIHASSILDCEIQSFRLIDYLLLILNELQDNLVSHVQVMSNILKILSLYLVSNLHDLNEFCETPHFKTLLVVLYKNNKILTPEMIDYLLNLSFGVQDLTGINVFNPWYPKLITDILLDIHLFKLLNINLKIYILNRLISFLNQKDYIFIMYEANIETKVTIICKLYKIFMLVETNEEIDNMIITLINSLLEQTLKFKQGDVEPTEEQLNRIITGTQEFFFICGHFNESITNHLKYKDFDSEGLNTTRYLVKKYYVKLFKDSTKILMEKILNFFMKIREDITVNRSMLGRRGTSLNLGIKVGSLMNSNFFKKLYSRNLNEINVKENYIFEKKINNNDDKEELGISYNTNMIILKGLNSNKEDNFKGSSMWGSSSKVIDKNVITKSKTKIEKVNLKSISPVSSVNSVKSNTPTPDKEAVRSSPLYKSVMPSSKTSDKFNFKDKEKEKEKEKDILKNNSLNQNRNKDWMLVSTLRENDIGEDYITSDNKKIKISTTDLDSDFECIGDNCLLCNFFRYSILNSYHVTKKFNLFKKYIKNFYYILYHKTQRKKLVDEYFRMKGINFSWYIFNHEGPFRTRNKLSAKIDEIRNEELSKKFYEDIEKLVLEEKLHKISQLNNIFNFMDIKNIFSEVLFTDQIFNLNIVKNLIESDDLGCEDKNSYAMNCLLINECYQTDCVIVLGSSKFYILKNMHIDQDGNLLYSKESFKKHFWVVNDYKQEWSRGCPYLNNYESPKEDNNENKQNSKNKNNENLDKSDNSFSNKYGISNSMRKMSDEIRMYKFSRSRKEIKIYTYDYTEINEIHKRRFLLKNNALEFFLKCGKNFILAFNVDKRDTVFSEIIKAISLLKEKNKSSFHTSNSLLTSNSVFYSNNHKILVRKHKGKVKYSMNKGVIDYKQVLEECAESWATGVISNYSYLMMLNTLAGRSYTDVSQYLIMPWIIKDYSSEGLNLNTDEIYRNLSYPIHALDENSRKNLRSKFSEAEEVDKFHSGSHYSTPGFVCYYLIRLKPFSYISAEIQGGYFDMADRLFFHIKSLWDVSDKYQELIPELYCLPEIFVNYNEFNFGNTQSQNKVNDVILPSWAKGDPRLFIKMNKKALESSKVSQKISEWIDLIFGYKQQGNEAINNYNTFRGLCYEGRVDILSTCDEKELEDKMVEIHDFGQIPIMLFNKVHPKKERHEKSHAFFSRPSYLMHFVPKEKTYSITLESKPKEMKGYFEISEAIISRGEGGLSSFRMYQSDPEDKSNSGNKVTDATNTWTIVGKKKVLLGPKYIDFIDFANSKYSFLIVKPMSKIIFEFHTYREAAITDIKPTRDGKKLIIAFADGVISLYKLRKEKDRVIHPEYEKKKDKSIFKMFTRKENMPVNPTKKIPVLEKGLPTSKIDKDVFTSNLSDIYVREPNKNASYSIITDNNANTNLNKSVIQLPIIKSYNVNEEWKDYYVHSNQTGVNNSKNHTKGTSYYTIKLLKISKVINNPIKLIEICEMHSLLIIIDELDFVYLFDINKFKLMREIDYAKITKNLGYGSIKSIQICGLTGEFVLISNYSVFLFNVNGVLIGNVNIKEFDINNQIGKITCAIVKSLNNSQSEIHLFTGHESGSLFMWRLGVNKILIDETTGDIMNNVDQSILDAYRFAYNRKYYESKIKSFFDLRLKFNLVNEFINPKKNEALRLIKLTEDSSMLILIHDDNSLTYLSYAEFFNKKNKKASVKFCPQCNSQLGSSKYLCTLCDKKLCSQCKMEQIIPEISFKTSKPICNDCLSMICSTNKMLYDF